MAPKLERIDHTLVFVAERPAAEQRSARMLRLRRLEPLEFRASDGGLAGR